MYFRIRLRTTSSIVSPRRTVVALNRFLTTAGRFLRKRIPLVRRSRGVRTR